MIAAGFVGGVADGVAEVAKMELVKKAERERDEATYLRQRTLAEFEQGRQDERAGRERGWRMDEAGFEADKNAVQKGLDRDLEREKIKSEEKVAGIRANADRSAATQARLQESYLEGKKDLRQYMRDNMIEGEEAKKMLADYENDWASALGGKATQNTDAAASAPESIGGKTADDYFSFLKRKYPDRSDADIQARVKEKYPDAQAASGASDKSATVPEKQASKPAKPEYDKPFDGDSVPAPKPSMTFGDVASKTGGFIKSALVGSDEHNRSVALSMVRRALNNDPSAPPLSVDMARRALSSKDITPKEKATLQRYINENSQ